MDREKLSILVLRDLVLLAGPLVGAVDGVVVGFLMRLRVCAAMGYSPFVLSLSVLGVVVGEGLFHPQRWCCHHWHPRR